MISIPKASFINIFFFKIGFYANYFSVAKSTFMHMLIFQNQFGCKLLLLKLRSMYLFKLLIKLGIQDHFSFVFKILHM